MAGTFSGMGELPDLAVIRTLARDQLVLHLESLVGKKDLVLDTDLMKPLDRIAGASLLKQHGVDKIFKLEPAKNLPGCDQRIYIIRPRLDNVKFVADQINADIGMNKHLKYKILMTPRKLHVCERLLEQEGVHGHVTIEDFSLDLIMLDRDIVSLQLPEFFTSYFLEGDQTCCHTVANSLVNLQMTFGHIPNVYGVGRCSKIVYELSETLFDHFVDKKTNSKFIGQLILIDRDTDLITPLCSQVTYEGLLHDTFDMECGFVEFGEEVTGKEGKTKMLFTSHDPVYEDIRNRHFSNVFTYLSQTAKSLQSGYDKRHNITSVSEMKNFVSNDLKGLKQQHKSLALHVGACEVISGKKTKNSFDELLRTEHWLLEGVETKENINHIEELINKQTDRTQCLRLLCLLSLTQGGLASQVYKSMKTQFLQSYGFEQMLSFHNLKKLGMLVEYPKSEATKHLGKMAAVSSITKSCPFRSICKKMSLIPKSADDINLKSPNDMSYVFSGAYTPMLCKLVEQILAREGFLGLEDVMKLLPGEHFSNGKAKSAKGKAGVSPPKEDPWNNVVAVYFLGGCTYSEIAALRFLGKQRGYKFIVLTTHIINAQTFTKQCETG